MTKRELQEDNDELREKLEEAYDVIGEALGFEEEEENPREDEDGDPGDEEERVVMR